MALAERVTGLSDWEDTSFREPLDRLVSSLDREARMTYTGRRHARTVLTRCLANRLRITETLKRRPEIREFPLPRPIIIVGLARTGTTLTQRLLAEDPTTRAFRSWELARPAPPPSGEKVETDPRRIEMVRNARRFRRRMLSRKGAETIQALHKNGPDIPEECYPLMMNAFLTPMFSQIGICSEYCRWLWEQDLTEAYRYYRLQLRILTVDHGGERLVTKSPAHLTFLGALCEAMPDALIVWPHRDPAESVPSLAYLFSVARSVHNDIEPPKEAFQRMLRYVRHKLNCGMKARRSLGEERFVDVYFDDLVSRPIETVRGVYQRAGHELSDEAAAAIGAWLEKDRRERASQKRPKFQSEDFGVSAAEIHSELADYIERFNIPVRRA